MDEQNPIQAQGSFNSQELALWSQDSTPDRNNERNITKSNVSSNNKRTISNDISHDGGHEVTPIAKRHKGESSKKVDKQNGEMSSVDRNLEQTLGEQVTGGNIHPPNIEIDRDQSSVPQQQHSGDRERSPLKNNNGGVKKITQNDRDRAAKMVEHERRYWNAHYVRNETSMVNSGSKDDERGDNGDVHAVFSKLQSLAQQYGFSLQIPEIVVVGMQSDGKSTFIEALLGFQFNTIDTQIGTRRPLLLQMKNDPTCEEPVCTFAREDRTALESHSTPLDKIEEEIRRRTEERCGQDAVSSVPIIIEVRYKHCVNLNIYDMPGFRTSRNDPLANKIFKMNVHMMREKSRLIVCLEQSTVEWCNSQIRPILRKIDPQFERTVLVSTKFNNRVNQFKSETEIDGFLSTDGQIQSERVFFISLPSGAQARNLGSTEFKQLILDTYISDLRIMSLIGFNHNKYLPKIGFMRLRQHLEEDLNRRYRDAVAPIVSRLQLSYEKRRILLNSLEEEIERIERENIEQEISNLICSYVAGVHKALEGTVEFDPAANGMTLDEEKQASNCTAWSNYSLDMPVRNANLKLYGGSQIDRLLAEFEIVAHAQEFPATTDDEVAVTIGLNGMHTRPNFESGASDLARAKCRNTLHPLVDVLVERAKFIMKNTFHIVAEHMLAGMDKKKKNKSGGSGGNDGADSLQARQQTHFSGSQHSSQQSSSSSEASEPVSSGAGEEDESTQGRRAQQKKQKQEGQGIDWEPFFAALQKASNEFIESVLDSMKGKAGVEFDTFSRIIDWELMGYCGEQKADYDLLNPTHDDTKARVLDILQRQNAASAMSLFGDSTHRELSEDRCRTIKTVAARLFGGVRLLFVKYTRTKFNAFFINPIFTDMDQYLRNHFGALGSDNLKELVGLQIHKMKSEHERVSKHMEKVEDMLQKFRDVQCSLEQRLAEASNRS